MYPYDVAAALDHLARRDVRMGRVIERVGHYGLEHDTRRSPFEVLLESIIHQQLSGHAAAAISGRFHERVAERGRVRPPHVLRVPEQELRELGLSRSKVVAVRDLAARAAAGGVPDRRTLRWMEDEAVIDLFTEVRGVGRWTVEMLLMFSLGRPDVLAASDLGIRKGFRNAYRRRELPAEAELRRYGERWRPYRTVACWYLWRVS